jgi:hypothetical protein
MEFSVISKICSFCYYLIPYLPAKIGLNIVQKDWGMETRFIFQERLGFAEIHYWFGWKMDPRGGLNIGMSCQANVGPKFARFQVLELTLLPCPKLGDLVEIVLDFSFSFCHVLHYCSHKMKFTSITLNIIFM